MKSLVLYFLLLVLGILLNLGLDTCYKQSRFFKTLLKKNLKFILSKGVVVAFDLSLMLLPAKINPIVKEQSRKKNAIRVYIKIIFAL